MKYIFGNWKMYLNVAQSRSLAAALQYEDIPSSLECVVFPTLLSFCEVEKVLSQNSTIGVGVQNIVPVPAGAYTGAVSALFAHEAGAQYALVGHSERRYIFGEGDTDVLKQVKACEDVGITPVICIGETKADLDEGKKSYRLKKQLHTFLSEKDFSLPCIIAYEPVWAISSNKGSEACLPADADDVIGWIKQEIKNFTDSEIPVLYGGSVDETNALEFLTIPSGDGILIGSASTHISSFSSILQQASTLE